MPYKSQAQAAYFHTHKKELEKQGVSVKEWDAASEGKKLPKKAPKEVRKDASSMSISDTSHNYPTDRYAGWRYSSSMRAI